MAGHSKWANIKHRKGRQDIARSKIFTKLIREITVTARQGDDLNTNFKLRLAVDKALEHNMSRDTIDRAIRRGIGGEANDNMEEIIYEGYGVNGVAIMVECLTDNRNRTVGDVRHILNKYGGNLGTGGSVSYLFKQAGIIELAADVSEEQMMEIAMAYGAEDIMVNSGGNWEVLTNQELFWPIKQGLESSGLKVIGAELVRMAITKIALDKESEDKILSLVTALEELDDVQNVYTNIE